MNHVDERETHTLLSLQIFGLIKVVIISLKLHIYQCYHVRLCKVVNRDIPYHQGSKIHDFTVRLEQDPVQLNLVVDQLVLHTLFLFLFLGSGEVLVGEVSLVGTTVLWATQG